MKRKWLWIIGAVVAAAALLALGVSLQTLLILAALLACPAAMYVGMWRMGGRMGKGRLTERSHLEMVRFAYHSFKASANHSDSSAFLKLVKLV